MATAKKTPSGTWRVQIFLGKDKDGVKRKKSITAPTKREAERLAMEFLMANGLEEVDPNKITVRTQTLRTGLLYCQSRLHSAWTFRRNRPVSASRAALLQQQHTPSEKPILECPVLRAVP